METIEVFIDRSDFYDEYLLPIMEENEHANQSNLS